MWCPIKMNSFRNSVKVINRVRYVASATTAESPKTVNEEEVKKFSYNINGWWDVFGSFKPLHSMNALRVPFIRDGVLLYSGLTREETRIPKPMTGLRILDVGCGGGILSEPLARLGASVTGLDPNKEAVEIALTHASYDCDVKERLNYVCETVEEHLSRNTTPYDAVVVSEVAEHVQDIRVLVNTCVKLTRDGGSLFFTTINKNYLAWFLTIFVAENVMKFVPKGTHLYDLLVPVEELEYQLKSAGTKVHLIHGMMYNPCLNVWYWSKYTTVNYAIHAIKSKRDNE